MNQKKAKQLRNAVKAAFAGYVYDQFTKRPSREALEIWVRGGMKNRWSLVSQLGDYDVKKVGKRVFQVVDGSGFRPVILDMVQFTLAKGSPKAAYRSAKRAARTGGLDAAFDAIARAA